MGDVLGVDGVADFDESGLDVSGGELAEGLAGDQKICGAVVVAAGGENCSRLDIPATVTLDEDEAFVGGDGGDASDEFGSLRGGGRGFRFGGFVRTVGEEDGGEDGEQSRDAFHHRWTRDRVWPGEEVGADPHGRR